MQEFNMDMKILYPDTNNDVNLANDMLPMIHSEKYINSCEQTQPELLQGGSTKNNEVVYAEISLRDAISKTQSWKAEVQTWTDLNSEKKVGVNSFTMFSIIQLHIFLVVGI